MGLRKETTPLLSLAQRAQRARAEGRTVFLVRYELGSSDGEYTSGGSSRVLTAAAEVIESVERAGWQLSQFAYSGQAMPAQSTALVLLFRSR